MKFLPRLTTLLLIGLLTLLIAGGAAGARAFGLAPAAASARATTAQDQPTSASTVPPVVAVTTAIVRGSPSPDGGSAALPGLPGSDATEEGNPVAAVAPGPPGTASATTPAVAPGGQVTLTGDPPILRRPTDTATVTAVVTDSAGMPLAGILVTFRLDDAETGQLGAVQVRTDAAGAATTTFAPEIFRGKATIVATTAEGLVGQVTIGVSCGC